MHFQELGFYGVKAVDRPKEYNPKNINFDLAVLTLARLVEGNAPMPLNWGDKPLEDSIATIVGFGHTGGSRLDYGIEREGSVRIKRCVGGYAKIPLMCWNFDADATWRASAQSTCNGDSGGGAFIRDNDNDHAIGPQNSFTFGTLWKAILLAWSGVASP